MAASSTMFSPSSMPPNQFLTTVPTSFTPPKRFGDSIPSSMSDASRIGIKVQEGSTQAQGSVTVNVVFKEPRRDEYGYVYELQIGQPLFVTKQDDPNEVGTFNNLRQVNQILAAGYNKAIFLFSKQSSSKDPSVITQGILSRSEYKRLFSSSTETWINLPFVENIFNNSKKKDASAINYLFEEGVREAFAFFGFLQYPLTPDIGLIQGSVVVSNIVNDVENIFGPHVTPGKRLFFIFKRVERAPGKWGAFAFHPYCDHYPPAMCDRAYMDVSGVTRYGPVVEIGIVQTTGFQSPTHSPFFPSFDNEYTREAIGISATAPRESILKSPGKTPLTVCLKHRVGTAIPFHF